MPRSATALLVCAAATLVSCDKGPSLPPIDAAAHQTEWTAWRDKRLKTITTPGRPMFYTGLQWLHPGDNSVGSDSTSDIVLAGAGVPRTVGRLVRDSFTIRFEPASGAKVTIDSHPAMAKQLRTDADSGTPSVVEVGNAGFKVIKRVDSIGVRSWDREHPARAAFKGLEYFPLDLAWRIPGRLIPQVPPSKVAVITESGFAEDYTVMGHVETTIGGEPYKLLAYKGSNPVDLFFTFADAAAGEETYGFRFLHAALDTVTKVVTLDFNYAYNPDCAFSSFTTCPLPPPENRIRTKMLVGEKKYLREGSTGPRRK